MATGFGSSRYFSGSPIRYASKGSAYMQHSFIYTNNDRGYKIMGDVFDMTLVFLSCTYIKHDLYTYTTVIAI